MMRGLQGPLQCHVSTRRIYGGSCSREHTMANLGSGDVIGDLVAEEESRGGKCNIRLAKRMPPSDLLNVFVRRVNGRGQGSGNRCRRVCTDTPRRRDIMNI